MREAVELADKKINEAETEFSVSYALLSSLKKRSKFNRTTINDTSTCTFDSLLISNR